MKEIIVKVKKTEEPEFIGQFIDVFEDFLDSKGISIDNADRDADRDADDDDAAIIYGDDYDILADEILSVLHNWEKEK